ncbi:hypothetical protein HPB52_004604 [Rhipicephalus sanguineus]|uniref:TRAF1-6 MATH domain-containing protein n=1 Tax=Rhipicephalus sanguineus TaxID=34632 RepID=A0A9D4T5I7_RHISA|nr:hypothetical protein HPB52_004604 [Rhipicephalus sanguineus]
MAITPGPFRTASKLGMFITMVFFADIYQLRDSLGDDKNEVFKRLKNICLGGYRFDFDCLFIRDGDGQVQMGFNLFLVSGEWDDYLEWPFAKNITVIVTHLRDHMKDIRLPIRMTWANATRKPPPGEENPHGGGYRGLSWQQVELNGFIVGKALYLTRDDEGQVRMVFSVFLVSGEWDDYVEWPFTKKLTATLTHIKDQEKDIRLPIRMPSLNVTKKPAPGKSNAFGNENENVSWRRVELNGFIVNDTLYVNIDFE